VRLAAAAIGATCAAGDLVQEALVRIWRHPEVLSNGEGSVRGWLFKTMRNIAGAAPHPARA
jgi:RNA polymerase sigma-70 factor, ECF subfamily